MAIASRSFAVMRQAGTLRSPQMELCDSEPDFPPVHLVLGVVLVVAALMLLIATIRRRMLGLVIGRGECIWPACLLVLVSALFVHWSLSNLRIGPYAIAGMFWTSDQPVEFILQLDVQII